MYNQSVATPQRLLLTKGRFYSRNAVILGQADSDTGKSMKPQHFLRGGGMKVQCKNYKLLNWKIIALPKF